MTVLQALQANESARLRQAANGRRIDLETALDEVVADSCERFLLDSDAMARLEELSDKSLVEKIKSKVAEMIKKLRHILSKAGAQSDEGAILQGWKNSKDSADYEKLLSVWSDALLEAGEKYRKGAEIEKGPVKYSIDHKIFTDEETEHNIQILANMKSVYDVDASKLEKTGKRPADIFQEYFDSWGNLIKSKQFGDISLRRSSVKSEVRHGITAVKIASIEAIPAVLDNGVVIWSTKKAGTSTERIVAAAPIRIGNNNYYMGVMLQRDVDDQHLYLHNVVIEEEMSSSSQAPRLTTGPEGDEHLFITSILQNALNVKYNGKKSAGENQRVLENASDIEYLELVKEPEKNRERLQRLVEKAAKAAGYDSPDLYHGTKSFGFTEFDLSKLDDKRSIFLTSDEQIASTYSGTSKVRSVSEGRLSDSEIQKMTPEDLVEALNRESTRLKDAGDEYSEYDNRYAVYGIQETNKLIASVNERLEDLGKKVDGLIEEYADRMAEDFNDEDAKIHRQLVDLKEKIDRYDYANLSTPIYMLLHHTEVFERSAEIGKLEKDIRLMNKLRNADTSEGVIAEEGLGGYSIEILDSEGAKEKLTEMVKTGNYVLKARLGNSLVVDCKGKQWNNITGWAPGVTVENTKVVKNGNVYTLTDLDGNKLTDYEMRPYAEGAFTEKSLHEFLVGKANNIIRIREDAEGPRNTRYISKYAKEHGYDSVVFKNIKDNGGRNSSVDYDRTSDVYVVFDPENVKSADPVTYDDAGKVIPLEERFNPEKKDIRYSEEIGDKQLYEALEAFTEFDAEKFFADKQAERTALSYERSSRGLSGNSLRRFFQFHKNVKNQKKVLSCGKKSATIEKKNTSIRRNARCLKESI